MSKVGVARKMPNFPGKVRITNPHNIGLMKILSDFVASKGVKFLTEKGLVGVRWENVRKELFINFVNKNGDSHPGVLNGMKAPSTDYKLRTVTLIGIQHHAKQQEKFLLHGVDIDNYEVCDVQSRCQMLWAQFTCIAAAAAEESTKKTASTNTPREMNEGAEKEMDFREERH